MAKHRATEVTIIERVIAFFFSATDHAVKRFFKGLLHLASITAVGLPSILFFEALRGFFETGFHVVHAAFTVWI